MFQFFLNQYQAIAELFARTDQAQWAFFLGFTVTLVFMVWWLTKRAAHERHRGCVNSLERVLPKYYDALDILRSLRHRVRGMFDLSHDERDALNHDIDLVQRLLQDQHPYEWSGKEPVGVGASSRPHNAAYN